MKGFTSKRVASCFTDKVFDRGSMAALKSEVCRQAPYYSQTGRYCENVIMGNALGRARRVWERLGYLQKERRA